MPYAAGNQWAFKKREDYTVAAIEDPALAVGDKPRPPHKPEPEEPAEPKPQPKPDEPPEVRAVTPPPVAFTPAEFKEIIATVIAEARKPVRDERAVARLKRMKEHNHAMQQDNRTMLLARFHNCNHMQLPGSVMTGCACIAWATQSDQKKRGVCQHCGTIFSSEKSECLNEEVWEAYKMLVRLPTHPAGNINSIFQSA